MGGPKGIGKLEVGGTLTTSVHCPVLFLLHQIHSVLSHSYCVNHQPSAMALVSAANILRSISLFHLTLAYFLLVSPSMIADQNLVFILGEAMRLVRISDIAKTDFVWTLTTIA